MANRLWITLPVIWSTGWRHHSMDVYKKRKIVYGDTAISGNWRVKVHLITYREKFGAVNVLQNAISNLPKWLEEFSRIDLPISMIGSLIVHEGKDGVWTLLSFWAGGNMLRTTTFYSPFTDESDFQLLERGSMACVWELAVIDHERRAWVKHVLMNCIPDYAAYLNDTLTADV